MKRREFLATSLALGTSGAFSNLFAKDKFTIYGAPSLPSITIAVATLQGKLSKKYDTNLQIWQSPDQLRAGVANGSFKVMMAPSNVGLNLANQGANVGQINILTQGFNSIMSKNGTMSELGELYGKKMIMPFKNDMPDIVIKVLFKKLNLDINQVNIDYASTPTEALTIFLSKDYDAAYLPEPMASASVLKGKTMGISINRSFDILKQWKESFNQKIALIPQAGVIADIDFFKKSLEDFEILHEDLVNALKWQKENPQSAAEIATNYLSASIPAIANAVPYANLCVLKSSEIKEEMNKFFEVLLDYNPKLIGGKLPKDEFYLW